jgi:hypothetical protein
MIERGKRVNGDKFWQMGSALIVTALLFISSNAVAQVTKITTKSGAMIGKTQPKASMVVPDARPKVEEALPAGATVIYSNFGTGNSLYDGGEGWTEAGAEANDFPITEAMAFTPDANYNVIRVDVAVTYVQGTNGMTLVLAEDNGGVPGQGSWYGNLHQPARFWNLLRG